MRLGYVCVNLTLGRKQRTLRLATLQQKGMPYLQTLIDDNLALLGDVLRWNAENGVEMFRYGADIIPFGSHASVDLAEIDFSAAAALPTLAAGQRMSVHPGQFTVISAEGAVWDHCQRELSYQNYIMDTLGLDGDILIHGGGVYGDPVGTARRIAAHIKELPPAVHRRLCLENDERSWSVLDLLPLCEETGVKLIVDVLHHRLNGGGEGGVPFDKLPWGRIGATWTASGRLPKLHYSEQDPAKQPGAHGAYVDAASFRRFQQGIALREYDVMLECKAKDLALQRLREELASCASY